jgi:hypothetical protein
MADDSATDPVSLSTNVSFAVFVVAAFYLAETQIAAGRNGAWWRDLWLILWVTVVVPFVWVALTMVAQRTLRLHTRPHVTNTGRVAVLLSAAGVMLVLLWSKENDWWVYAALVAMSTYWKLVFFREGYKAGLAGTTGTATPLHAESRSPID